MTELKNIYIYRSGKYILVKKKFETPSKLYYFDKRE